VASKHPVDLIKDAALGTIKDPLGTAGKAVGQAVGTARGTVAVGRMVVGAVGSRLPVPAILRPGSPAAPTTPANATSPRLEAVRHDGSRKVHGDPLEPAVVRSTKAPAKKAPAKKAPARKAPVTAIDAAADADRVEATPAEVAKVVAKKAPAKKAAARKTPKKAPAKTTPPAATEPLIDPAVTKAVAGEAATGARAASTDKG
jgi:hypothetical protein